MGSVGRATENNESSIMSEGEIHTFIDKYFAPRNRPPRPDLPVVGHWNVIKQSIDNNPVTIIIGSTGCGKTTQVPQLILEETLYKQQKPCRIVVTQPRRIAAMSVAKQVCRERAWTLGTICGYQVGMDKSASLDTCINYVTTNILVERIVHSGTLGQYTHIIVDEIHERHQDLDCLLYLLKRMSLEETDVVQPRIILMSATAESSLYSKYFLEERVGTVRLEGRRHSVTELYLDDLDECIRRDLEPTVFLEKLSDQPYGEAAVRRKVGISQGQVKAVAELVCSLDKREDAAVSGRGAVLIFLPGVAEIRTMIRCLESYTSEPFKLVTLHSKVPLEEQHRAFLPAPPNKRKVIVATNIAESSITVPDVRYVIDFCLTKTEVVDPTSGFLSYQVEFCSQASCNQRAGRAGRVQKGVVFRLLTKQAYNTLPEYSVPEILRSPVDITVLKIKKFGLSVPKDVLANFISPPKAEEVSRAIIKLKEIQAMQLEHRGKVDLEDGDLTVMGQVMAKLPLDVHLTKLILMGFAFGCFEECVKMAACLSVEDILCQTPEPMERYKTKLHWARGHFSDPIMFLNAFDEYLTHKEVLGPADEIRTARAWAQGNRCELRRLVEAYHLYEELKARLSHLGFTKPDGPNRTPREPALQNFLRQVALCAAFYPHYYQQKPIDFYRIKTIVGNNNPFTTMVIKGLHTDYAPLYIEAIRANLQPCLTDEADFIVKDGSVYLSFKNHDAAHVPQAAYLCQKYYNMRKTITVPRISAERASYLIQNQENGAEDPEMLVAPSKPPLPSQAIFTGCVSWWCEDAFQLYFQLDERAQGFASLRNEIFHELGPGATTKLTPVHAKVDMLVLAYFEAVLYRARVVAVSGSSVRVFFIDYGNTAEVKQVFAIPPKMLLCSTDPPYAYLAQLARLQSPDGNIPRAKPFQKLYVGRPCRVELFSVVDEVLRVDLFIKADDDDEIHVNKKLLYENIAVLLDEPDISEQSHEYDIQSGGVFRPTVTSQYVVRGSAFVGVNEEYLGKETIQAPFSPLAKECRLTTLKRLAVKDTTIAEQSVNHVMFGDTGLQRRFVVAHSHRLSSDRRVQLLRTTLMPKLNMMLPFVALVFAPRAEYRCNEKQTAYIGAICGLGGRERDDKAIVSVCPESDMEVAFSHALRRRDVKTINRIRRLLNEAFCSRSSVCRWGSTPILRIQDTLVREMIRFFQDDTRQRLGEPAAGEELTRWKFEYKWSKVSQTFDEEDHVSRQQALFRPHCIVPIRNEKMFTLIMQTISFMEACSRATNSQILMCPLCVKVFGTPEAAKSHLTDSDHQLRYAKLTANCELEEKLRTVEAETHELR